MRTRTLSGMLVRFAITLWMNGVMWTCVMLTNERWVTLAEVARGMLVHMSWMARLLGRSALGWRARRKSDMMCEGDLQLGLLAVPLHSRCRPRLHPPGPGTLPG